MALPPSPMPGGAPAGPGGPGAPPPPGGMPGAHPAGPPGGTGPATVSSAMPGMAHQGMQKLKTALMLLQQGIGELPMGSPMHQKVMKFIMDVSKELGQQADEQSDVKQQIASMARQGPNPMAQAAMEKMMPPPGGGGGPPPGGPPM